MSNRTALVTTPTSTHSTTSTRSTTVRRGVMRVGIPISTAQQSLLQAGNYSRLSAATGISRSHVSKVLRGKCGMSTDVATKLSQATGIRIDQLLAYVDTVAGRV